MSTLLKKLTSEQRSIIEKSDGYSLIIASAGTGKTTTIVGRIAYLLEVKKVKPENILLLTFTNKAAEEMIGRLKKHYRKRASKRRQNMEWYLSLYIKSPPAKTSKRSTRTT